MKLTQPIQSLEFDLLSIEKEIKKLSPPIAIGSRYNSLIELKRRYLAAIKILKVMEL